jgi:hypothetical protein
MYQPTVNAWNQPENPQSAAATAQGNEEGDISHRPPNAFILYSQAMRSVVHQDNPSLSNTEVSRLLGQMWKEVSSEAKLQYKQRAAIAQEEFKREHPDYTYRKARRKRALNELLTKSTQGFPMNSFPGDPSMFNAGSIPPYYLQMLSQNNAQSGIQPGQLNQFGQFGQFGQVGQAGPVGQSGGLGLPNMSLPMGGANGPSQFQGGYGNATGYPGMSDPNQNSLYSFQGK